MKILHVITSLSTGGAERLMVDLLPRLKECGDDVELCVFYGLRTPFFEELETKGVKIHVLSERPDYYSLKNIGRLRRIMRGVDIVHTHNTAAQLFAAMAKPKGVTLYTTEHSTSTRRRNYRILRLLDKWMYSQYEQIICISEIAEKSLRAYIGQNYPIITIENGVNLERFRTAEPVNFGIGENIAITMVAGFRYEKDQPTLIKSLLYLPENYHVVLVGDGEKRKAIEELIVDLNLQNRVHLLGVRTDVPAILKSSDVIVMSSHREGLSLSNVEGMASGNPFVASDVDGLREVTKDAGILFPHQDAKALAEIILKLTTEQEYCEEVVYRCQERANCYDIRNMVDKYARIYHSSV